MCAHAMPECCNNFLFRIVIINERKTFTLILRTDYHFCKAFFDVPVWLPPPPSSLLLIVPLLLLTMMVL